MAHTLSPSEQLTFSTVRIECDLPDGTRSTGSGFFFQCLQQAETHVPVIVTNKHVVKDALRGRFSLTLKGADDGPMVGRHLALELDRFETRWIDHPSSDVDLAIMPVAPLLNEAKDRGQQFFYISLDKSLIPSAAERQDLTALEDIIMIGYPNGIWDPVNNQPVIRRGVSATHIALDYAGKREFMIDAACFPGSSGSPVFLFNTGGWTDKRGNVNLGAMRIKLLGALYAGPQHTAEGDVVIVDVPTTNRTVALSRIPNNLGLVIRSELLLDFDDLLRPLFKAASPSTEPAATTDERRRLS